MQGRWNSDSAFFYGILAVSVNAKLRKKVEFFGKKFEKKSLGDCPS